MISLHKCSESCNVSSPKMYFPKETKDRNVKTFNMITNKNDAKAITVHILCYWKWKLNSTICKSNQKWHNKTCQYESESYRMCKEQFY